MIPNNVFGEDFTLTILHTNDIHARVEQFNKHGSACKPTDKSCFGGVARRHAVIEEIRARDKNVILLDAGDQYQGTLWFNIYKGMSAVTFMNYSNYDVMTLGNHEFDLGVDGLVPFLKNAAFPIVSANIDVSNEPKWPKKGIPKSFVLTRQGKDIGVIGYITPDTEWISNPGDGIKFSNVVESVRKEAQRLKKAGVSIIIALGHAGIDEDKKVAKEVDEVDVVVGGHSNTFLYTGTPPSSEKSEGGYPLIYTHDDGTQALVVQDYAYGKYLGHLKVTFDDKGNVKSWLGNPILLNSSFAQDPKLLKIVSAMDEKIVEAREKSIGNSLVHLEGDRKVCRQQECNMGNLIADAIVKQTQKAPDEDSWATVALGVWNSGGIRASIKKNRTSHISQSDVTRVLPFGNSADLIEIEGIYLRQMFEHSASALKLFDGRFLQVSGFQLKYDRSQPVGKRLVEIKALCISCKIPKYELLDDAKRYKVVIPNFIIDGGNGFDMLKNNLIKRHSGDDGMIHVREFIKEESPVVAVVEGRIEFVATTNTAPTLGRLSSILLFFSIVFNLRHCKM